MKEQQSRISECYMNCANQRYNHIECANKCTDLIDNRLSYILSGGTTLTINAALLIENIPFCIESTILFIKTMSQLVIAHAAGSLVSNLKITS
jgi:hypothetical protein